MEIARTCLCGKIKCLRALCVTSAITVLIPTHNRPNMLKNALESVALQSRKELISEVVISDSGFGGESRDVVAEFSRELPVRYIHQQGAISAQENGIRLAQEAETKYVALLADDDMCSRYHLEEAYRCFQERQSVHAFFGQCVAVANECCMPFEKFSGSFLQVPLNPERSLEDFRVWGPKEVAAHCLANTPLNIWTAVVLTESHQAAVSTSAGDPVYGKYPANDRLYIWRLAMQGDIAISRNISLFYRRHSESDIQTQISRDMAKALEEDFLISKEILRQAENLGISVLSEWHRLFAIAESHGLAGQIDIAPQLRELLFINQELQINEEPLIDEDQRQVDPDPGVLHRDPRSFRSRFGDVYRLFAPPILEKLRHRISRAKYNLD